MKKISVIIPVYQTKHYLPETMDSVFDQRFDKYEIILVDDGSTDGSGELCDEYANNFPQVKVIHQKNKGLGMARNAGLKEATGEYVMFLDSDDLLDGPDVLAKMYSSAHNNKSDIVQGSYRRFSDGKKHRVLYHHLDGLDSRGKLFRFRGFYQYEHLSYSWGKLYRRTFLIDNGLWQKPYPFTQDKAHNLMVLANKPVYSFVKSSVVLYRVNTSSVTFKYKEEYGKKWQKLIKDFDFYLRDNNIKEDYSDMIDLHYFSGAYFVAKQEILRDKAEGRTMAKKALKEYFNDRDARRAVYSLAFGNVLPSKAPMFWHVSTRLSSLLLILHAYSLFIVACKLVMDRRNGFK